MTRSNFIIAVTIAVITISFWAYVNRPEKEPPWPERIQGFSFSPMRKGQSAIERIFPTVEQIDEDLALLAGKTNAVRIYTMEDVFPEVPRLARKYGINVTLGAWIDGDLEKNEKQIKKLIETANNNYQNVVRVVVGNESILTGALTVKQVIGYLDRVREALPMPVSTAEPWHVWYKYPELADHVDFIGAHMLPYWEGVHIDRAVDYVVDHVNLLKTAFPNKSVIIAEVGWPSNGRTRYSAEASESNEATFLRRFLARAEKEKYIYYIMEAFDQPWKKVTEGAVGAYWGVYNVDRKPKFFFSEPIVEIPEWRILAAISVGVAIITFALLLIDSETLQAQGRSFLATLAYSAATAGVWIIYRYTRQYMTAATVSIGFLMIIGMIGVVVVLLAEAHEWAEARWTARWRRPFTPIIAKEEDLPMVSIHLPAYNEPPDMVIETLNALSRLYYPRYEVIVVDNNTKDPDVWLPVEAHCRQLGSKFKFFHVDPLSGYKAGALNYALKNTSSEASVIAVIDSDYTVSSNWLRDLVPQFNKPEVAIVQGPQDYRDNGLNIFKAMCYAEYRGFFYIGMVTRNERNAIIQHGTMTMVRRSALEEVGGWAEWCITEDAELGLRIFEKGYDAVYIPESYGKGLTPDTFIDFKKQRSRWAYGAMQILKRHTKALMGFKKTKLTYGQRYHFIAGWLPWISDGINLVFTIAALFWSTAMAIAPNKIDPPMMILSVLPLTLFIFKAAKIIYLYRTRVSATIGQTFAAAFTGLSLSHTIAKAIFLGLFTSDKPFFRTPKMVRSHPFTQALGSAREEGLVLFALLCAAASVKIGQHYDTPDHLVWVLFLLIQSIPYFAAVTLSMASSFSKLPMNIIINMTAPPGSDAATEKKLTTAG